MAQTALALTLHLILACVVHLSSSELVSTPAPPPVTPSPHVDPGTPAVGQYTVKNINGTVCVKANMALQINISFTSAARNTVVQKVVNLNPNETVSSGFCGKESATLTLSSGKKTELTFAFILNTTTNRFHLSGVSIMAIWPDMKGSFSARNDSLNYLRGILGFSYMCRAEQTLEVTPDFSLNTYMLKVQPFGLTGDVFGAAVDCLVDEDNLIIPIVVGAALAVLVLIVLLAYLIGRRRSHAGYQTI